MVKSHLFEEVVGCIRQVEDEPSARRQRQTNCYAFSGSREQLPCALPFSGTIQPTFDKTPRAITDLQIRCAGFAPTGVKAAGVAPCCLLRSAVNPKPESRLPVGPRVSHRGGLGVHSQSAPLFHHFFARRSPSRTDRKTRLRSAHGGHSLRRPSVRVVGALGSSAARQNFGAPETGAPRRCRCAGARRRRRRGRCLGGARRIQRGVGG